MTILPINLSLNQRQQNGKTNGYQNELKQDLTENSLKGIQPLAKESTVEQPKKSQ